MTTSEPASLVTAVVTSCGRYDLLHATLSSLIATSSAPLARIIVVEDGPAIPSAVRTDFRPHPIDWIDTGERVGQIPAIDYAYSRVETPYIFHLEDDWEFLAPGYVERSMVVLQSNPSCLQVWIRGIGSEPRHPLADGEFDNHGVRWRQVSTSFEALCGTEMALWRGFSFNPGLRRLSDYVAVGGYGTHARFDASNPGRAELDIGELYYRRGFFAAQLVDRGEHGYVRHLGWGRQVSPNLAPRYSL